MLNSDTEPERYFMGDIRETPFGSFRNSTTYRNAPAADPVTVTPQILQTLAAIQDSLERSGRDGRGSGGFRTQAEEDLHGMLVSLFVANGADPGLSTRTADALVHSLRNYQDTALRQANGPAPNQS